MLYLVEGLNCAGKSTFIDKVLLASVINTYHANPLRWNEAKNHFISNKTSYLIGIYETIIRIFAANGYGYVYWDRTFISAYAYSTIFKDAFLYLLIIGQEMKLKSSNAVLSTIFIDTEPKICLERLRALRKKDPNYRNYVWSNTLKEMKQIRSKFLEAFDIMEKKGFEIKTIK